MFSENMLSISVVGFEKFARTNLKSWHMSRILRKKSASQKPQKDHHMGTLA